MQLQEQTFELPTAFRGRATLVHGQLESVRASIESRFSFAGGQLAGSLDMVGRLIESLDRLGVTLNIDAVSETTDDLLSTANSLNALPDSQAGRIACFASLKAASASLDANIGEMRKTLRYLRAFALNVKITAGSTLLASDDFGDFANQMCTQLDLGVAELDHLGEQLKELSTHLQGALDFEQALSGKYRTLIPAVPDRLAVDARGIEAHHSRVASVAGSVACIARDIQAKVGKALIALQIGDITRQRIEHVQTGIEVTDRLVGSSDLSAEARDRAERRLLHLLADQMAEIASQFETDAAKVTDNLDGMAADTAQIRSVNQLSEGPGKGGLRDLEHSLGHAGQLVGDVTAAMSNARRIGNDAVSAVEALSQRVDAIHGVKRDIQQMTINSSLRCHRLGKAGNALGVIAIELSGHAARLEAEADQTLGSLAKLADIANGMAAGVNTGGDIDSARLDGVRNRLREAADVVEQDITSLGDQGEEAAQSLIQAAGQLGLKEDLGDALHTAAIALADAAGLVVNDVADIAPVVNAAMTEIARAYTMVREREIHGRHILPGGAEVETGSEPSVPSLAVARPVDEFDDLLF